jgi:hypothetical protein
MNVLPALVPNSLTALTFSNLRNGAVTAIHAVARPSSIPDEFHWRPVTITANWLGYAVLAANAQVANQIILTAHIASSFGTIVGTRARVAQTGAAAVAAAAGAAAVGHGAGVWGNAAGAPAAAFHTAFADPSNRLAAIVLGSARHALTSSLAPGAGDFKPNEIAGSVITVDHVGAVGVAPAHNTVTFTSGNSVAANNLSRLEAAAGQMAPLSDAEMDLSAMVQRMALGAGPLAGMHLVVDTHHYLSGRAKRNEGVERQVIADTPDPAKAIWSANTVTIRDTLWHKSIHPLSTTFLISLAVDPLMPARLQRANLGSAAVALPVREGPLQTADAYLAVFRAVATVASGHGVTMDSTTLHNAVLATRAFVRAEAPNAAVVNQAAAVALNPPDALVVDLGTAIDRVLKPAIANAAAGAAFCFGYFKALTREHNISATSPEGTLLGSFALQNAAKQVPGEAARGATVHDRGTRLLDAQAKKGNIVPVTIAL